MYQNELINSQVIRLKDVITLTGLSRSTIYEKQDPKSKRFDSFFPKKIKLGSRAVGWLRGDVLSWISKISTEQHNK